MTRNDAVIQVGYDSQVDLECCMASVQDTLSVTGDRQENARAGVGGSFQALQTETARSMLKSPSGDLGAGGQAWDRITFMSDRTSMYLNYSLENERTDNGLRSGPRQRR